MTQVSSNNVPVSKQAQIRGIAVQKKNLIQVCRYAVKSLIDKSCFESIDDNCDELVNFLAIMEHVLSHRLKSNQTWFGVSEARQFWDYIRAACKKVPHSCISSIENMENVKSSKAKGRAWLRMVLMEKRLSEYLSVALKQVKVTKTYYQEGAVMLSEEISILLGVLLGLNAIDFSFCLKGKELENGALPMIDYTPYLRFQQSQGYISESIADDERELNDLSSVGTNDSFNDFDMVESESLENTWKAKFQKIEAQLKTNMEQKGYLEELVRLREDQLEAAIHQKVVLVQQLQEQEIAHRQEHAQLENIVLELQEQLVQAKDLAKRHQVELNEYILSRQPQNLPPGAEIPMNEMINLAGTGGSVKYTRQKEMAPMKSGPPHSPRVSQDARSIISTTSTLSTLSLGSGNVVTGKEGDSASIVPLIGSLQSIPDTMAKARSDHPETSTPVPHDERVAQGQGQGQGQAVIMEDGNEKHSLDKDTVQEDTTGVSGELITGQADDQAVQQMLVSAMEVTSQAQGQGEIEGHSGNDEEGAEAQTFAESSHIPQDGDLHQEDSSSLKETQKETSDPGKELEEGHSEGEDHQDAVQKHDQGQGHTKIDEKGQQEGQQEGHASPMMLSAESSSDPEDGSKGKGSDWEMVNTGSEPSSKRSSSPEMLNPSEEEEEDEDETLKEKEEESEEEQEG
ncbi:RUN domain-containing protein 3B-like isoform X1 [Lingula anatina]|uniref:RUN domain-containing protein 3B-like isoform X1 n=1 Tax=Lingula anatina TaxID=7574 RepID=A0A2R2MLD6_LINAN|nr:RUN domain-containing protein 3B-like isoform X1 [Lingula anatina]|eukprot:XP_023931020.1 RUN domain-containing protein 3B-like isoform X1 [Lingula anatina]